MERSGGEAATERGRLEAGTGRVLDLGCAFELASTYDEVRARARAMSSPCVWRKSSAPRRIGRKTTRSINCHELL